MTRIAGLLSCCCVAWLAACTGQDASTPPASTPKAASAPARPVVEPEIVVQLAHQAPVVAVQWVDRGRHLVSLARDGSIVFWDVASGAILDHAQMPHDLRVAEGDALPLRAFATDADAASLAIAYSIPGDDARPPDTICPGAARRDVRTCSYTLDLATRSVRPDAGVTLPADPPRDAAARFPQSPDGTLRPEPNHADGARGLFDEHDDNLQFDDPTCVSLARCRYGVNLFRTGSTTPAIRLVGQPRSYFLDADLSADGRQMVRVEALVNATESRVQVLDLGSGTGERAFVPAGAYHRVTWVGPRRYLLQSEGFDATDDTADAAAGLPPAQVADPACALRGACPRIDSRWQMQALDDGGSFVALGSMAGCYRAAGRGVFCPGSEADAAGATSLDPPADGLLFHAAGASGWAPMQQPDWRGQVITAIQSSPDRRQLAVATRAWEQVGTPGLRLVLRVWLLDIDGRTAVAPERALVTIEHPVADAGAFSDSDAIRALSFTADGTRIVFTQALAAVGDAANLYIADAQGDKPVRKLPGFSRRVVAIGNARAFDLDRQTLVDIDSGKPIARDMGQAPLVAAGWIDAGKLLWAATDDGVLRFWDGVDGSPQLSLYTFPDNRYFALAPGGRYDTNLVADTNVVRWRVPDAPWQSLAAQTFMRDYYTPGLYAKLLDCRAAGQCADAFKALPPIASLNRVLPQVRIADVRAGRSAAEAVVTLELREGVDAAAPNGKTRSGVYNPRLFRNGRVVAMAPLQPDADGETLPAWRRRNAVEGTAGGATRRLAFTVPLPTGAGEDVQVFSAYAFNDDRIKGETASIRYTRPSVAPVAPRAYVVAIGIDDYDTPRFRLNYSVADARLLASRLAQVPGYDTRALVLAGERDAHGRRHRIDRATIVRVLSLLAGDGDRAATLRALKAAGIDASMLQPATPDDLVIVSYSGHGWADRQGGFFLIPTDGRWPDGARMPDLASVLPTSALVAPLRAMAAGEIALVIDACHSSASVADGRFKPGPMGDGGLGQLAYDKGIRILAATQADDVAFEDARLKQGLLTYALAVDGLAPGGGKADLDGDGTIRLDEWLAYAVRRLPSLAVEARAGPAGAAPSGARAITFDDEPADATPSRVQQPSLFDFNAMPSPVALRRSGG